MLTCLSAVDEPLYSRVTAFFPLLIFEALGGKCEGSLGGKSVLLMVQLYSLYLPVTRTGLAM